MPVFRHDDLIGSPLHQESRDWRERRCTQRFTGAQAEAGMVPGTTDRLLVDGAFGQRAAVVAARRANGDIVLAESCKEHWLAEGVTQ